MNKEKSKTEIENIKKIVKERLPLNEFDEDMAVILAWLSDKKEHWDMPDDIDEEDFDYTIEKLIDHGYVKNSLTKDEGYKLSRKGCKLIDDVLSEEAAAENNCNSSNSDSTGNVQTSCRTDFPDYDITKDERLHKTLRDKKYECILRNSIKEGVIIEHEKSFEWGLHDFDNRKALLAYYAKKVSEKIWNGYNKWATFEHTFGIKQLSSKIIRNADYPEHCEIIDKLF